MGTDIKVRSTDPEYGGLIDSFMANPLRANLTKPGALVDVLTEIVVGTNQVRYGPRPSPEVLVSIRDVLRDLTTANAPIRILSPWGTLKPVAHHGIDVAEVAAMLRMRTLQEEVKAVYDPGIDWHVAVESSGGFYNRKMEIEADPTIDRAIHSYIGSIAPLALALGLYDFTKVKLEHLLPNAHEFAPTADALAAPLFRYLNCGRARDLQAANELGFTGDIPQEMRDFYLNSYRKNRPNQSEQVHLLTLARYMAQANTRYKLGMKAPASWGDSYLQVNFPPPVPGVPDHLSKRRLFYRTMPSKHTNNHVPPWRGKGFLCIIGGQTVQFKLTSWHQLPENLVPNQIEIEGNGARVTVEADYVLR